VLAVSVALVVVRATARTGDQPLRCRRALDGQRVLLRGGRVGGVVLAAADVAGGDQRQRYLEQGVDDQYQ
jgi:hypothetical protein